MVSFQCDACQDVVKKPKLDTHSYRCYSSFTCVDCSKTFHTSAEWKGHTSCISEEEKYQKGLYKGKKAQKQSGPKGDKVISATNDAPSKLITSQMQSSEPEVHDNNPQTEINDPIGADTASTSVAAAKKEKKRKHKSVENQAARTEASTIEEGNGEKKKKKKQKLDTKVKDEKPEDEANIEEAHQMSEFSLVDHVEDSKKEKRRKEKKKKEKSARETEGGEIGAPPPTQPVVSTTEDSAMPSVDPKEKKEKPLKPEKDEQGTIAALTVQKLSAEEVVPSKNKKDKKKRKAQEDASLQSSTEDGRSPDTGELDRKKRKRSEQDGDGGVIAGSAEKAKKEKKKKSKAPLGSEAEKNRES